MPDENQTFERKSLRYALGKQDEADGLACDCVGLANARGGLILLGLENDQDQPPAAQRVPDDLPEFLRKRIPQITVNVGLEVRKARADNGGEFIAIQVCRNQQTIASTTDGRYFLRVCDQTRRLLPDDLGRLMADKNSFVWELQASKARQSAIDRTKLDDFLGRVHASDRVSAFVTKKSEAELLEYYLFAKNGLLTNLGVLWIGRREDRASLLHAPAIQFIKFDERERKVRKLVWDDFSLNPLELIEAVWRDVPDWQESYEFPDGLFRKTVPHFEEAVVRELLANALVHRPYTQRGDIFLNLYPDRLEVHSPGLLPIGVTPRNILHASSKRNPHLAKVCFDLKLMEGEGSGFDRMYELLLRSGRRVPEVREGDNRVVVTVWKKILDPTILDFMFKADQAFQLTQKELIALGLLAQCEALTASELAKRLELSRTEELARWIGRLKGLKVVKTRGRTKATEYLVDPHALRKLELKGETSLRGIETHRLRELILRDLGIYRKAGISEIHKRIGQEIPRRKLQHQLQALLLEGMIGRRGVRKGAVYLWTKTP
ncbi:MAG: ATP-dependent DNA helicase [Elusimicrobia bacterium]|nr:ATP-dependent DNA helicase [Elusimicrobiota bacterium]